MALGLECTDCATLGLEGLGKDRRHVRSAFEPPNPAGRVSARNIYYVCFFLINVERFLHIVWELRDSRFAGKGRRRVREHFLL